MTRMASDRIRNTRQNCLFIQVPYAERIHIYNFIAAATYHDPGAGIRGKTMDTRGHR
jgi:hypothetical protein